ncbi:MAG: glycosyltransferase [Phycisphaerales bacterium]|nr:MAG: glycosyltransferase [Phycisphaerales bacterium]
MGLIGYVVPTRNRPERIHALLAALGSLPAHDAELVIADNASAEPVRAPRELANGLPVTVLRLARNRAAAARNDAVQALDDSRDWAVMLDDDSAPTDLGFIQALRHQPGDVAAVMADIHLPRAGEREHGGLPEVFIGCGVAIRREAFLATGGYDPAFGYYAEEYDLAAKLILAGARVTFDPAFRVDHQKATEGRDTDLILHRLVRNNGWVMQRYAPDHERAAEMHEIRTRYKRIAEKEWALPGYTRGLRELKRTTILQPRTPMPQHLWERFTGFAAAHAALCAAQDRAPFRTAALVRPGKNARIVARAIEASGAAVVNDPENAEALVIGTLSPGPMIDAALEFSADLRLIAPWSVAQRYAETGAFEPDGTIPLAQEPNPATA